MEPPGSRRNRLAWEYWSDTYQARHGGLLAGDNAAAWGLWRVSERDLRLLGDVRDRLVLELGCGAAHWSAALRAMGARVVAMDCSTNQLAHAQATTRGTGVGLVQAEAEHLPFGDASFDIVFSDYGGMSWSDPADSVVEVGRVLRPNGLLVFCTANPLFVLCFDEGTGQVRSELLRDYFGLRARSVRGLATDFHRPFGEWIELLNGAGLVVERLVEPRPSPADFTTFAERPLDWARRWPMECIWKARKMAG